MNGLEGQALNWFSGKIQKASLQTWLPPAPGRNLWSQGNCRLHSHTCGATVHTSRMGIPGPARCCLWLLLQPAPNPSWTRAASRSKENSGSKIPTQGPTPTVQVLECFSVEDACSHGEPTLPPSGKCSLSLPARGSLGQPCCKGSGMQPAELVCSISHN